MTLMSRLLARLAKLPPAKTHDVIVERDLQVPMPDGVMLLADHYAPRDGERLPTILVRSPYGRRGFFGLLYGHIYAERGFQVLVQSVRGTFGSGGVFDPFNEHDDGLATIAWLKQQPWFSGLLATNGPSYLGLVQWAVARDAGDDIQAMAIQISTSNFHNRTYAGGAFGLDNALSWTYLMAFQEKGGFLRQMGARRKLRPIFARLPLRDLDQLAIGQHSHFFQNWLEHTAADSDYWQRRTFDKTVPEVSAPINFVGGWYDIFLPWQLRDYRLLRDAGKQPYLTIGPWAHASFGVFGISAREALAWFNAHLLGDRSQLRQMPVRIFVTGANEWRDLPDWPPDTHQQRFYLQPGRGLAPNLPGASEPDHYRYDPADPTPALSGPVLMGQSLPTDNRKLEERPDVLTYTSAPLEHDLEVIGTVQADLFVRSSLQHTDFFARLCEVDEWDKSLNICDALLRVTPGRPTPAADGTLHLTFDLWPTAHRFRRGHRLRLQVSSGAHPRYARNTGSGEPLASAAKLFVADQTVYHDPDHPSAVVLSIARA